MAKFFEFLTSAFQFSNQYEIGRKAVLIWCLVNMAIMMVDFDLFWGGENLVPATHDLVSWKTYLTFDFLHLFEPHSPLRYGLALLYMTALIGALFAVQRTIFMVLCWVLAHTFLVSNHFIADGGDRLILQILNYILIADLSSLIGIAPLRNAIRNLSVISIMIQVCLIYFATSVSKLSGEYWTSGTAIYYIMNIDEYTIPLVAEFAREIPMLTVFATYLVVLHQLSFVFLIVHPLARPVMLSLGCAIHIGIAILTGIASFGFAMSISYLFFLDRAKAERIEERISCLNERILGFAKQLVKWPLRAS